MASLRFFGLALAFAATASSPLLAQAQRLPRDTRVAVAARTQAQLDAYVAADKMPGIVVAFGTQGSPPVFVSAGKIADGPAPAAGPDSLWRVYSMTKLVTAVAAMILIEEGKVGLDQPVADFIPAFRNMKVLVDPAKDLTSRPAARPITIRHLLTHTAGLGYDIVTTGPLLAEYNRLGIVPYQASAAIERVKRPARPASLAEFANRVATLPLIADPGTKWSYSVGLDVMGRVIEVAGGMPFDRFVQTRILDPLQMRSTWWTVPATEAGRLSTSYLIGNDNRVPVDPGATSSYLTPPNFPYGGAGLVASARDFDRFLEMMLDGGALGGVRILKPATVKLATSNLLPPGVVFTGASAATGGSGAGPHMGFGAGGSVYLEDVPGGPGAGTWGWGGAAGTVAWVDFKRRVRGTIMVNYAPAGRWPLRAEVIPAIYADLAP